MTFLEYYNLSKSENNVNSLNTGSLSNDKRTHRHEKALFGINQIMGKTKKLNSVPEYLTHKDDDINQCIKTGKDQPINPARAEQIKKDYGLCPTHEEPEKAIKQTNVYLVLTPNGLYKLTFKGKNYGNGKVFR
jgi:hypothetical protein